MASSAPEGLSDGCKGAPVAPGAKLPIVGHESLMSAKAHGTSEKPVQAKLRWGCDPKLADRICWCEHGGIASLRARVRARALPTGSARSEPRGARFLSPLFAGTPRRRL